MAKLIARLVRWLLAHGHTPAEVCDCIEYIADDRTKKAAPEAPGTAKDAET